MFVYLIFVCNIWYCPGDAAARRWGGAVRPGYGGGPPGYNSVPRSEKLQSRHPARTSSVRII